MSASKSGLMYPMDYVFPWEKKCKSCGVAFEPRKDEEVCQKTACLLSLLQERFPPDFVTDAKIGGKEVSCYGA